MLGTDRLKQTIKAKCGGAVLQKIALEEGMRTLRMDAIRKVFGGLTDMEQIRKVCI